MLQQCQFHPPPVFNCILSSRSSQTTPIHRPSSSPPQHRASQQPSSTSFCTPTRPRSVRQPESAPRSPEAPEGDFAPTTHTSARPPFRVTRACVFGRARAGPAPFRSPARVPQKAGSEPNAFSVFCRETGNKCQRGRILHQDHQLRPQSANPFPSLSTLKLPSLCTQLRYTTHSVTMAVHSPRAGRGRKDE